MNSRLLIALSLAFCFASHSVAAGPGECNLEPTADWSEGFDRYAAGSNIDGQGPWVAGNGTAIVVDGSFVLPPGVGLAQAVTRSDPNALFLMGTGGAHRAVCDANQSDGLETIVISAWVYIPSTMSGSAYFILLNEFEPGGPYDWSTQLHMNAESGHIAEEIHDCTDAPLQVDEFAQIEIEVNLQANTQVITYNGVSLNGTTGTFNDKGGPGVANLECIQLFAQDSSGFFYDDISTLVAPADGDRFIRGDADGNGVFSGLVDGLYILNAAFVLGSPQLGCLAAADADGDRQFNGLADGLYVLNAAFSGGLPPPAPFPTCGPDPDGIAALGCDAPAAGCN